MKRTAGVKHDNEANEKYKNDLYYLPSSSFIIHAFRHTLFFQNLLLYGQLQYSHECLIQYVLIKSSRLVT